MDEHYAYDTEDTVSNLPNLNQADEEKIVNETENQVDCEEPIGFEVC